MASKDVASQTDRVRYIRVIQYLISPLWLRPSTNIVVIAPAVVQSLKFKVPVVSQDVIIKASSLKGKPFLQYILYELNEEDREAIMLDENFRFKTFQYNWPHKTETRCGGQNMAATGFYSVNDIDRVRCVFCRGSLHRWDSEEDPSKAHAESFPYCPFILGHECGNIPLDTDKDEDTTSSSDLQNRTTASASARENHSPDCCHLNKMEGPGYACNIQQSNGSDRFNRLQLRHQAQVQKPEGKIVEATQQIMSAMCRQMGISQEDIDAATRAHGKPFQDLSELTDAISLAQRNSPQIVVDTEMISITPSKPPDTADYTENHTKSCDIMVQDNLTPACYQERPLQCLNRGIHKQSYVAATHVGLPCGDLILCESCNQKEFEKKNTDPEYQPNCPKCGKCLAGTLHVYFS